MSCFIDLAPEGRCSWKSKKRAKTQKQPVCLCASFWHQNSQLALLEVSDWQSQDYPHRYLHWWIPLTSGHLHQDTIPKPYIGARIKQIFFSTGAKGKLVKCTHLNGDRKTLENMSWPVHKHIIANQSLQIQTLKCPEGPSWLHSVWSHPRDLVELTYRLLPKWMRASWFHLLSLAKQNPQE